MHLSLVADLVLLILRLEKQRQDVGSQLQAHLGEAVSKEATIVDGVLSNVLDEPSLLV